MIDSKIIMTFQMKIYLLFRNKMTQGMINSSPQKIENKKNNPHTILPNSQAHQKNQTRKHSNNNNNNSKTLKRINQNYC